MNALASTPPQDKTKRMLAISWNHSPLAPGVPGLSPSSDCVPQKGVFTLGSAPPQSTQTPEDAISGILNADDVERDGDMGKLHFCAFCEV